MVFLIGIGRFKGGLERVPDYNSEVGKVNREQILAMEHGPELDDLVAEKVLGFSIDRFTAHYDGMSESCRVWINGEGRKINPINLSANISAAWEVVEKMKERSRWFGVDSVGDQYRCIFRLKDNQVEGGWYEVHAESVPLAICRASLLAVLNL